MPPILKIKEISKNFEQKIALDKINFEVEAGSIFGLLGPNGAGKTTLIRILTQIFKADSGQIWFNNRPLVQEDVYQIGYMPEERGLYKKMQIGEQLIYLAQLKGLSYIEAKNRLKNWFEKFEIQDWWTKKVEELSKGMQQKVQFIATIVHQPKFLILDEPLSGLDPVNSELINQEILNLKKQGSTILFSTHRMEQVEEICGSIVLINQGKVVLDGNIKTVKEKFKENVFKVSFSGEVEMSKINVDSFDIINSQAGLMFVKSKNATSASEVLKYLLGQQIDITSFNEVLPSLNEIFIKTVHK
jgi:ABC-2 type transport system ATP-binding protein